MSLSFGGNVTRKFRLKLAINLAGLVDVSEAQHLPSFAP